MKWFRVIVIITKYWGGGKNNDDDDDDASEWCGDVRCNAAGVAWSRLEQTAAHERTTKPAANHIHQVSL